MTTSPQWKDALLHNLERLNALQLQVQQSATLYASYPQDYSKHAYLRKQKSPNIFATFFLQKVF